MKASLSVFFRILPLSLLAALFFEACDPRPPSDMEGYADNHYGLLKTDPDFADRVRKWQGGVEDFIQEDMEFGVLGIRSTVVTIPVVVHVVHRSTDGLGSGTNLSEARIDAQIARLNADFRAANTDLASPPPAIAAAVAAFGVLAADTRIEFARAVRDPTCAATTGITRTATSVSAFNYNPAGATGPARNPVKFNASGGRDAWDAQRYLNIWVCDLATGDGYASHPADLASRPAEDGVVVDYTRFDSDQRTLTNRVARWLGLLPIYGDPTDCASDDGIGDTPAQGRFTGCPTHPRPACNASENAMFINFMDDTDDNCKVMYTTGQADFMNASLFTSRAGLLGSAGLAPPVTAADLWAKDTDADIGNEPNLESVTFYQTEDIWVRHASDGVSHQEHHNPLGGAGNFVYVRVRNRGCNNSAGANVRLYWAKASSGLAWPAPWDGSATSASGAVLGGQIGGPVSTGSIPGGGERIVEFAWTSTPDPAAYSADFGADNGHFCLLAIIDEPPLDLSGGVGAFTRANNEIVWKNVHVDGASGGDAEMNGATLAANFTKEDMAVRLRFQTPPGEASVFEWGNIEVQLSEPLLALWKNGGNKGSDIQWDGTTLTLLREGATLENIVLPPGAVYPVRLRFVKKSTAPKTRDVYKLDMQQWALQGSAETLIGGQLFVLKVERDPMAPVDSGDKGKDRPWGRWGLILLGVVVALLGWRFRNKFFQNK